jgi:hypothetical protein
MERQTKAHPMRIADIGGHLDGVDADLRLACRDKCAITNLA